tara:strand:+ start:202 stop:888 length:687 start_codon:yes stop_codon:yes gene_type:complete
MKLTKQMLHEMIEEVIQEGKKPGESNAEYHARLIAKIMNPEKRNKKKPTKRPTDTKSPFRDRGAASATDKLNPVQEADEEEEGWAAKILKKWASDPEPTPGGIPGVPNQRSKMPFRDRDDYEASQRLNPDVVDPFQQGYIDGKAAGKSQIDADPDFQIKSSDPVHQQTIDAATAGQEESYRDGFYQGYGNEWPSTHGTNISSDMPIYPKRIDFKDSPPVNRDFNKWKP